MAELNPWDSRDGELAVNCWCEESIVFVPKEMVKNGLTWPCRNVRCRREAHEHNCVPKGRIYVASHQRAIIEVDKRNEIRLRKAIFGNRKREEG